MSTSMKRSQPNDVAAAAEWLSATTAIFTHNRVTARDAQQPEI